MVLNSPKSSTDQGAAVAPIGAAAAATDTYTATGEGAATGGGVAIGGGASACAIRTGIATRTIDPQWRLSLTCPGHAPGFFI
jgi:hypothetical protein